MPQQPFWSRNLFSFSYRSIKQMTKLFEEERREITYKPPKRFWQRG
jgi:hypothetical protein